MAIHTLIDCNGFRSGSTIGVESWAGGSFTVDTAVGHGITAFPLAKGGPYIGRIGIFGVSVHSLSKMIDTPSSGWVAMAFYAYLHEQVANPSEDTVIKCVAANLRQHWRLTVRSDRSMRLFDATDSLVVTSPGSAFVEGFWYRFVIMFQWGSSSALKVWAAPQGGSQRLRFDESGMNTRHSSATDVGMAFHVSKTNIAPHNNIYIANYVLMTSDQTNWDDNDLTGEISNILFMGDPTVLATCGDWTVLGPYRSAISTNAPDVGDDLDVGPWNKAEEIPLNQANAIRYTQPGPPANMEGNVYCNDGSLGGPSGDGDVDNQIVGCVWAVRKRTSGTGFNDPSIQFVRGKWEGSTLTRTYTPAEKHTAWKNSHYVEGGSTDLRVPTTSGWMAMGMRLGAAGFSGGPWVEIADFYGTILHAETPPEPSVSRLVNLDGFIVEA